MSVGSTYPQTWSVMGAARNSGQILYHLLVAILEDRQIS